MSGPGLHTGKFTHACMIPAPAGSGIVIRRTDVRPTALIPVLADNVADTNHGTTVARRGVYVSTIEHMMSAIHGMRIDNAVIEVDGPEIPILDGSSHLWVEKIMEVGIETQDVERKYLCLTEEVRWEDLNAGIEMVATPAEDFRVDCQIEFKSGLIGIQRATLTSYDDYVKEISKCRTFVFLHEVEVLLSLNLIKGGDLDNALVFVDKPLGDEEKSRLAALFNKDRNSIQVDNGVLNTVKPYFPNEPARHKLLDFMGDIYLVGMPVKGHFALRCPGHRANTELAKKIRSTIKKLA